jgi:hypothetical protein
MEAKKVYEKPMLRKVRLEVKNSVLATCHTSTSISAKTADFPCNVVTCFTYS